MNVGHVQSITCFSQQILHYALALHRLHAETEGTLKGCTMTRHVYLGDKRHIMLTAELRQLTRLLKRVISSLVTLHILRSIEHRIKLALQTPSLVFGKMPMEDVYLETAQQLYLLLKFVHRYEAASDVVHKSTYTECRPVGDVTDGNVLLAFTYSGKLLQRLLGTEQSHIACGVYADFMLVDNQAICFVLPLSTFHSVHLRKAYISVCPDILIRHTHLLRHGQQWWHIGVYGYAQDKQQHH